MNIQNVLLWLKYRHGDVCAHMVDGIDNNAVFHFNSHISQMPPQIIHILRFSGRFAAQICNENVLRSGLFGGQKSGSSYGSLILLHFQTRGSE